MLTGTDGLSAGIAQNLCHALAPDYRRPPVQHGELHRAGREDAGARPGLRRRRRRTTRPDRCWSTTRTRSPNPPTTAEELLAWAKANPGKFGYARPANSGPGRTFLMGLPYILGDNDPKDPTNGWAKTWAYLKELSKYIDHYPTGTGQTMTNLANGTVDMVATTTGWDINPRVLGTRAGHYKIATLKGFPWVTDAQYAVVPKGVVRRQAVGDPAAAAVHARRRSSTPWRTTPATSTRARPSRASTLDMAPAGQPGRDQEVRPDRVRRPDRGQPQGDPAATPTRWSKAFDKWDREVGGRERSRRRSEQPTASEVRDAASWRGSAARFGGQRRAGRTST